MFLSDGVGGWAAAPFKLCEQFRGRGGQWYVPAFIVEGEPSLPRPAADVIVFAQRVSEQRGRSLFRTDKLDRYRTVETAAVQHYVAVLGEGNNSQRRQRIL